MDPNEPQGTSNCINETFPLQQYSCEICHIHIYTSTIYWRHIIHLYQTMVENGIFGYEGQLPSLDTATQQAENRATQATLDQQVGPIKQIEYDGWGWGKKEEETVQTDTAGYNGQQDEIIIDSSGKVIITPAETQSIWHTAGGVPDQRRGNPRILGEANAKTR